MDKSSKKEPVANEANERKKKSLSLDVVVRKAKKSIKKTGTLPASQKASPQSTSARHAAKSKSNRQRTGQHAAKGNLLARLQSLPTRQKIAIGVALLIALPTAGLWYTKSHKDDAGSHAASSQHSDADGAVTYRTVLPAGKSIDDLGGWKRVSPPEGDPVYAYADTIDGVAVSVSQQPLPRSIKESTDEWVANLAKKFNATNRISADGNSVYIGTSAKGPQSVIFRVDELLILIKSDSKIQDQSWATYARSLM